ncbi:MAG: hypothetical protein RLZZ440_2266 [Planctomycetota bacterium]
MHRFIVCTALLAVTLLAPVSGRCQLVDTLSATSISQDMQAGNAGNAGNATRAGGDPAAEPASTTASESVGMGGVKYIPAYAIVLMLVGLSGFVACRPSRRHSAD